MLGRLGQSQGVAVHPTTLLPRSIQLGGVLLGYVLLVGCGVAPFKSTLPALAPLQSLTVSEICTLQEEAAAYSHRALSKEEACTVVAQSSGWYQATIDETVDDEEVCAESLEECLAEEEPAPFECSANPSTAGCEYTVEVYEGCHTEVVKANLDVAASGCQGIDANARVWAALTPNCARFFAGCGLFDGSTAE